MSETTDKTRVTDWNAWLGDVPEEPWHVGCGWCGPPLAPGVVCKAYCGVHFVSQGRAWEPADSGGGCAECLRLAVERAGAPCSSWCMRP